MTLRGLRAVSQYLWLALILAVAWYFFSQQGDRIGEVLKNVSLLDLAAPLLALLAAKVFLTGYVRAVARSQSFAMTWRQAAFAYNISQVPKYLPGSVWQFLSRAVLYKSVGMNLDQIRTVILVEIAWLVSSAFLVGIPALILKGDIVFDALGLSELDRGSLILGVIVIGLFAAGLFALLAVRFGARLRRMIAPLRPRPQLLAMLAATWIALGFSFWLLLPDFSFAQTPMVISLFAIAYGLGTVSVFAPAGLGIRETVLVVGLTGSVLPAEAAVAVALHRVLYVIADFASAGIAYLVGASDGQSAENTAS